MTLFSCSTITNAVINHAVQPHLGPCAGAMDSVRKDRGAPTHKEYNETEDLDTRQQQVEHVWYYTAPRESTVVVRFSWNPADSDCTISEKPSNAGSRVGSTGHRATRQPLVRDPAFRNNARRGLSTQKVAAYQRMKLSARGGRLVGNSSFLSAAAAGRSLSAIR
jgi:hypothetical protein